MRLFAERGFATTRVEDIVREAGYTRGAFYFHFANKLDCFWDVIAYREELRGDWVAHVTADLDRGTTLEQVLALTFARFAEVEQGVGAWMLVMVDFFQQHRDDDDVQQKLAGVYAVWHGSLLRFLRALHSGGWIPGHPDLDLLATQIFAYVEGLTAHSRLYGFAPKRFEAALFDGLVSLLSRSEGRRP